MTSPEKLQHPFHFSNQTPNDFSPTHPYPQLPPFSPKVETDPVLFNQTFPNTIDYPYIQNFPYNGLNLHTPRTQNLLNDIKKQSNFFPYSNESQLQSTFPLHPQQSQILVDKQTQNKALSSRIALFKCENTNNLINVIKGFSNISDISAYKKINVFNEVLFAVGWFDSRKITLQVQQLKLLFENTTTEKLEYLFIKDNIALNSIIPHYEFRFLENSYAEIYITCSALGRLDSSFKNDLYLHLSRFGCIEEFEYIQNLSSVFKCSYFDVRAAFEAKKDNNIIIGNVRVNIKATLIELYESSNTNDSNCKLIFPQQHGSEVTNWLSGGITQNNMRYIEPSPEEWRKYQQLKYRRLASLPFGFTYVPQENLIDIEKIQSGQDTRNTLMIRNIPNKITHEELKEFIDTTSKNTYDFLYLRIDFENHCNVGYAFISFTDPKHIIRFYNERAGKKWNRFNSEKICELAYARVQGKSKLIEKFRNSKVMEENPEYRPKIYNTEGPLKGLEAKFPSPDRLL